MCSSKNDQKKDGFTLIEIMITVAIIGLMTAIIVSYLGAIKSRGRDTKRIADIKQIEQGIEVYFSSCNAYPANLGGLILDCNNSPILSSIPTNPSGTAYGTVYPYAVASDPTLQYHVCAILELGYAGGIGKSGHEPINNATPADVCDGRRPDVFDKYGP